MNKTLDYYMSQSLRDEKIDIDAIKNNFYLLQENEIELLKNDKKLFKHFYGEDNYQLLYNFFLNENNNTNSYRFRYGRTKCLINILEEKIKKEKNKNKIFYLENELSRLRTKEKKIKLKNQNFLILEEKNKKLNINSLISGWEKGLSKGISFVFSSDKPEDSKVKKYVKLLLKVITIGLGIVMYIKAAIAIPILLLPIIIMAGYFLYKILALGTKGAIKVYSKVISQSWVSKIFGVREEKLKEMSNNAEEFKTKFEEFIDEKEKAAKKTMMNFIQNKIMKFGENNPKLALTLKIALLLYKSWRIFLSPITFIIQFFSGMLLKTCGSVADSLLKIIKKESTVEAVISGIGLDAEALGLKKENKEITKESLLDSLENDYYEHIKNQTVKKSLFAKHYNLYNERVIDQTKDNFFSSFYKKNKVEVVSASFNKNNFKFDISPISGVIKIKKDKNQIKDAEEIKNILKTNGLKDESKIQIGNDGNIVIDDENFKIIKSEVFNSKTSETTDETKPEEEKPEEEKSEEEKAEDNLLENNEKLFINIDKDSSLENLKIIKDKPSESDDILGYIELTKKENSNLFTADIYLKKIIDYKKNDLLKIIFEAEEKQNEFVKLTEEPAELELKMENNKFILSQKGGFLGFNKKISKVGKINTKYKEYVSKTIPEIEKIIIKNNKEIKKDEPILKEKLENISNIDWESNITDIKDKKIEDIESSLKDKFGSEMEKAEKEEGGELISQRNAITLGLFSVISGSALAWHMGGGSTGLGVIISGMMDTGGKVSQSVAKDLFQKVSDNDLTKEVKFDGQGQKTFFQKLYESFGLKFKGNLDSAKVDPKNPEDIKISGGGSEFNKGPDIDGETEGFEVDEKLKSPSNEPIPSDKKPVEVKEESATDKKETVNESKKSKTINNTNKKETEEMVETDLGFNDLVRIKISEYNDEKFLFNEYFKLEGRLNRWKK